MAEGLLDFANDIVPAAEAVSPGGMSPGQFNAGGIDYGSDVAPTPFVPGDSSLYSGGGGGVNFGRDLMAGAGKVGSAVGKEFTDRPLDALGKSLGLATTGLNIGNQFRVQGQLSQQTSAIKKAQQAASAAAAPAVAAGTSNVNRAQAGKLPQPMEDSVNQWLQQATADIQARYASMGAGNSSNIESDIQKAKLMAQNMRANLLQAQESLGVSELQTGVSAATASGAMSTQQQNLLVGLIGQANQALGLLGGRG